VSRRFRVKEFGRPISLRQALSYLDSRGWTTRNDRGLIACEGSADDAGKPIIAFIPNDETCPDYPLRLEDLIFVLSTLEERPAAEIANEMAEASEPTAEKRRSQTDDLIHILKQHVRGGQSAGLAQQLAKQLRVLAENVELTLIAGNASFQGAALFLAGCARILSPANEPRQFMRRLREWAGVRLRIAPPATLDEPKLLLWRLCEWAGLKLRLSSPAMLDKLYELALTEDPKSPDTLLEWLWSHSLDDIQDPKAQDIDKNARRSNKPRHA
jgi:hypothetical protein